MVELEVVPLACHSKCSMLNFPLTAVVCESCQIANLKRVLQVADMASLSVLSEMHGHASIDTESLFSRPNKPSSGLHQYNPHKAKGQQTFRMFSGIERDVDADMMRAYQMVQELAEQITHNKNIVAQLQHQASLLKVFLIDWCFINC